MMTSHVLRAILLVLALASLSAPAGALQLLVWDPQLQTKLGYGELSGGRLTVQLVQSYSGPVVALFTRDAAEKSEYPGLLARYDGQLRGGQLTLNTPDGAGVPLGRFLSGYKLSLSLQNPAKSITLPGLKAAPAAAPSSSNTLPGSK